MLKYLLPTKNLAGVVFGLDLLRTDDSLHDAFLIDDEGRAERAEVFAAIHALLAPDAKLLHKGLLRVCDEMEGQLMLGDEFLMRLGIIHAGTHHGIALSTECLDVVT